MARFSLMLATLLAVSAILSASPIQEPHHQEKILQQGSNGLEEYATHEDTRSQDEGQIRMMSQEKNLEKIDKMNAKFKKMMKTTKKEERDVDLLLKNAKSPETNIEEDYSQAAEEIAKIHHKATVDKAAERILKKIEKMEPLTK